MYVYFCTQALISGFRSLTNRKSTYLRPFTFSFQHQHQNNTRDSIYFTAGSGKLFECFVNGTKASLKIVLKICRTDAQRVRNCSTQMRSSPILNLRSFSPSTRKAHRQAGLLHLTLWHKGSNLSACWKLTLSLTMTRHHDKTNGSVSCCCL